MSGGQKQRLALACAVLHHPELLLLDEPTSAVDPQSRRDFWANLFRLAEGGTTIMVSTHYMDEAERCHRLAILDRGVKVADGTPQELQASTGMHIIEVSADDPYRAQEALDDGDDIASVTQLGMRLRVLIPEQFEDPVGLVHRPADGHGVTAEVRTTTASLEDVFVAVTMGTEGTPHEIAVTACSPSPRKKYGSLRRDRLTFGMIVGIPVMQMLLFGYAINTDVRNLRTAIADQANTHLSRQFIAELSETQVVDIVDYVTTPAELEEHLRMGEMSVGVVIPADFDRRVIDPERPAVHLLVDGSDPTISASQSSCATCRSRSIRARQRRSNNIEVRPSYNPERRTPVNIIPGLMGVILTLTMMLFTAVAIVRERERGNLELLINTPVSSAELMIGKVIPYIVIGMIQLALILVVGDVLFQVPMRGSVLDLYLASGAFIAANLSLGLVISTVAKTQFQAMQMTFFVLMPSILLSGFVFPFDGMPDLRNIWAKCCP